MKTLLSPQNIFRAIGLLAGCGGILFVGLEVVNKWDQITTLNLGTTQILLFMFFALFYGVMNFLLVLAWIQYLTHQGVTVTWNWATCAYGSSQIAKYIPGNIFHLAGRQALGLAAAIPGKPLAKSMAMELGGFIVSSLLFPLALIPLACNIHEVWGTLLFLAGGGVVVTAVSRIFSPAAARAVFIQVLFFLFYAALFCLVVYGLTNQNMGAKWITIGSTSIVAWLAGCLTPGAPAGIGVREVVMAFLLQGVLGEAEILGAIVLVRLITTIGDIAFFFGSLTFCNKNRENYAC